MATSEGAVEKRGLFYGWLLLPTLLVFSFTQYSVWIPSMGPNTIPVTTELNLSRAVVAGAYSFASLFGFGAPIYGYLLDRLGPRLMLALGGFIVGLGALSNSLTGTSVIFWYAGWALSAGVGGAIAGYLGTSKVVSNWFVKRRGLGIGLLTFSGAFVYMTGTIHAAFIESFGWRTSWLIWAIATWAITIPLALLVVRDYPEEKGYRSDGVPMTAAEQQAWRAERAQQRTGAALAARAAAAGDVNFTVLDALKTRALWLMCITGMAGGLLSAIQITQQVPHVQSLGISAVAAAAVLGTMGLAGAPARFLIGWVIDRLGKQSARYIWSLGLIVQLVGIVILIYAKDLTMVWVFALLYGFGLGMIVTTPLAMLSLYFGANSFGTAYGVYLFITRIASVIGPVFAGWVFDTTGSYINAFWTAAGVLIVGIVLILLAAPPKVAIGAVAPQPAKGTAS